LSGIVITGGAGFIGSHLCDRLLEMGRQVVCLDNFDDYYDPAMKMSNLEHARSSKGFRLIQADIRQADGLESALGNLEIEAIVHLAARPGVTQSVKDPQTTFSNNVLGTQNVLDFCRKKDVQRLLFASSSSVYGSQRMGPLREDMCADRPESPYGASKRMGEIMCFAYHRAYSFDTICMRFFTAYGPRQRPEMAVHEFVKQALTQHTLSAHGPPDTSRDYTYVSDVIECVTRILDRCHGYEVVNIGGGKPVMLSDLLRTIMRATGVFPEITWKPGRVGDVPFTNADTNKLKQLIGWVPSTPIDKGVIQFVQWFKAIHHM